LATRRRGVPVARSRPGCAVFLASGFEQASSQPDYQMSFIP
jgi:hypothetical protein